MTILQRGEGWERDRKCIQVLLCLNPFHYSRLDPGPGKWLNIKSCKQYSIWHMSTDYELDYNNISRLNFSILGVILWLCERLYVFIETTSWTFISVSGYNVSTGHSKWLRKNTHSTRMHTQNESTSGRWNGIRLLL